MRRLIVSICLLTGCAEIQFQNTGGAGASGGEGGIGAGMGGVQNGTGGAGAAGCDADSECVEVPGGFSGPFVRQSRDGAPCPPRLTGFSGGYLDAAGPGFTAAAAVCNCTCQPPVPTCPPAVAAIAATTDCTGSAATAQLAEGTCAQVDAIRSLEVSGAFLPVTYDCSSDEAPATLPPVQYALPVQTCQVGGPTCGERSRCVASELESCIVSDENVACPAGFPQRFEVVREKQLRDTRDCQCGCSTGTAPCGAEFEAFADSSCSEQLLLTSNGTCFSAVDGSPIGGLRYAPATGSCGFSSNTATGSVSATGISTLCCEGESG